MSVHSEIKASMAERATNKAAVRARKVEMIRKMSLDGMNATQMAARLGMSDSQVCVIRKQLGLSGPGDKQPFGCPEPGQ